ncbi:MAG TPA: hypothetical protein VFB37_04705, partial [Steroidobacteraceae bacterium]|nr:hypothetical protein [Steroidobacteraceae bacterium]
MTRMGRRMAAVVALCAALPLILLALAAARQADTAGDALITSRLTDASTLYADLIKSRLGVAETIVEAITANDVGSERSTLERQAGNSRAFKSVVITDSEG